MIKVQGGDPTTMELREQTISETTLPGKRGKNILLFFIRSTLKVMTRRPSRIPRAKGTKHQILLRQNGNILYKY